MDAVMPLNEYKNLIRRHNTKATAVKKGGVTISESKGKYNNKKVHDEKYGWFDSVREYNRFKSLLLLEAKGAITDLKRQVWYHLVIGGQKIESYKADFTYHERGLFIVEDSKGAITPAYRRKRKWMRGQFGIIIRET